MTIWHWKTTCASFPWGRPPAQLLASLVAYSFFCRFEASCPLRQVHWLLFLFNSHLFGHSADTRWMQFLDILRDTILLYSAWSLVLTIFLPPFPQCSMSLRYESVFKIYLWRLDSPTIIEMASSGYVSTITRYLKDGNMRNQVMEVGSVVERKYWKTMMENRAFEVRKNPGTRGLSQVSTRVTSANTHSIHTCFDQMHLPLSS